jgi:predicted aldo/keto reductase-like oxidoreductase
MDTESPTHDFLHVRFRAPRFTYNRPVCRLGVASRGHTGMTAEDYRYALERGVTFFNWCGTPNALSQMIATLGPRRREVLICVQFEARTAADAEVELPAILKELGTDYVDILTFYYVEDASEWEQIIGPGGAYAFCGEAQAQGRVRLLGVTSHQRRLAAKMTRSRLLDALMIRYNAAHRGAETEIFPTTDAAGVPVIAYTCLRWGALLRSTPEDPPGFAVPPAPDWYRFVLQNPSVAVALTAPDNRAELEEDLTVLEQNQPLTPATYELLAAHGRRVRKFAGSFP